MTHTHAADSVGNDCAVVVAQSPQKARVGLTAEPHQFAYGECPCLNALGGHQPQEARTLRFGDGVEIHAMQQNFAFDGLRGKRERTNECGLACAVLPKQRHQLPTIKRKVQTTEQGGGLLSVGISHCEILSFKYCHDSVS